MYNGSWVLEVLRVACVIFGWAFFAVCAVVGTMVILVFNQPADKRPAHHNKKEGLRVLVVDDSFLFRQNVHKVLSERGISEIDTAGDGREAMELVEAAAKCGRPYRLLLIDWNMPKASGLEVILRLRKEAKHDRLVIMMISAQSDGASAREALSSGATDYITKPVSPEKLQERLGEALRLIEKGFAFRRPKEPSALRS